MSIIKKGKIISLLEGHKVTPKKALNKDKSRFAYELKGFKGLYELEGVDVSRKRFRYKKL